MTGPGQSGAPGPTRPSGLAGWIVALYPTAFRDEYGDDLAAFIDDRQAEPRFKGGRRARLALLTHLALDTVIAAPREHARALSARFRETAPSSPPAPHSEDRMDTLLQDLRYTLRTLTRRPAFTAIVVVTLMLGIGANTAIFSVVNAVLLRPLPYPHAEQLVVLWGTRPAEARLLVSIADIGDWRTRNHTLADIGLDRNQSVNLTGGGEPDRLVGSFITANTLTILGAHASRGRLFTAAETEVGKGQPVAVISDATWRGRFGSDSGIVGRTLVLNGRPHVVIGVLSSDFADPFGGSEVWLPITSAPNAAWFARGNGTAWGVARMKPGVTADAVRRDLSSVAAQLAAEFPASNAGLGVAVVSLTDQIVGNVRPMLLIVLAAVAVVLLIACANVANLQLARAASRRREIAVRAALGAGRGRLARQLLTESLVLSVAGGATGLLFARWATRALVAAVPGGLPVSGDVGLDSSVLAFAAAVTVAAGVLFGAAPALHAVRTNLNDALGARAGDGAIGGRVDARSTFVALQLALCVVLLVGAGLLTRTLATLQRVDPGFDPHALLTAEFRLPAAKYRDTASIIAFATRAIAEIRAVPGVQSAALVGAVPLSGNWDSDSYVSAEHPDVPAASAPSLQSNTTTDGYFRTMGIPFIAGRDFDDSDRFRSNPVVIVNKELARREWPGVSAIGKRIKLLRPNIWVTVVGVVGDVKHLTLQDTPTPQAYFPIAQAPNIFSSIVARTTGDPASFAKAVRAAIWTVDADQPVWRMRSMESFVDRQVATPAFIVVLTGAFSFLALLLATVGVYGVMSYAVEQRTREVGIRMALGAQRDQVVRLVLGRGLRVVGVATVIGLAAAFGATRLLRSQLYGVDPTDAVSFAAGPALLVLVAFLACWLPARRAARLDPVLALRSE